MRLAINGRFLTQPLTGVQRYSRELLFELDRLVTSEHQVRLLIPRNAIDRIPPLQSIEVQVVGRYRGHRWEQFELPAACEHELLFCPASTAPWRLLGKKPGVVVTVHGVAFIYEAASYSKLFRWFYRGLTRAIAKRSRAVIMVSEQERERFLKFYPKASARLHCIENGTIPHSFGDKPNRQSELRDTLLFVGTPTASKRPQWAVDAFAEIASDYPNLSLSMVGASASSYAKAGYSIPKELQHRVHIIGQVDSVEELETYYCRARALLFPSRYESFGLPPFEALACHCPVVVADLKVLRERLAGSALYFAVDSFPEMVAQLRKALSEPELVKACLKQAPDILTRYNWSRCAQRVWEVLEKAAAELAPFQAATEDLAGYSDKKYGPPVTNAGDD